MAKPATETRLAASAKGFTQVIKRGDNHIVTRDPTTGKCCYDGQVGGGWHYNGDQETDTAWEADSDQNYLKMVKAGYNLRARKLFNAGDLIQWTDPISGQYVKFQPQNFQWIDGTTGSNSLISVAQAISAPTIDDDKLYWPAAFGAGRHFRYTAAPTKLIKHLIIDSAANLPACPAYITNPWLELTFTLKPSSGVIMYVDGVAWNQATTKTTANAIEFRLPSGQVVWQLAAPTAYDSSGMAEPCIGQIHLYVNKKIKYCSVRFPKSWIDTAVFPIIFDPTVDYQVAASEDDCYWYSTTFNSNNTTIHLGRRLSGIYNTAIRFEGVTIPDGATIDISYLSFYFSAYVGTPVQCTLSAEDDANPDQITGYTDGDGRAKTTENIPVTGPTSGTWWDTDSTNSIIAELVMSYSYASGSAMQFIVIGSGTGSNYSSQYSADYDDGSYAPKLHIEYTEAASGKSQVIWI